MTKAAAPSSRLMLMSWLSPAFPVGGFAFSHGLEWAQETGAVTDRASLETWLGDLLTLGSGRTDAILTAAAFRAAQAGNKTLLAEVRELAAALQPSSERRLETLSQGKAFMSVIRAAWPHPALARMPEDWLGDLAYPVAVGIAAAAHDLPLAETLEAYLLAFLANLVSAAVRLSIVGQTDGQRVTAALSARVGPVAAFAETATLDDLGSATLRSDLMSLQHETQYSRLFRS